MTASTATTKSNKTTPAKEKQNKNFIREYILWLVLVLAILACVGVGLLFWGNEKQKTANKQQLESYSQQIAAMQAQNAQQQTAMQGSLQASLQKNQQTVRQALAQLNAGQAQADKQIALSSVVYLVRMANLALLINQDPKVATHFLDIAQARLKGMPALESLRSQITDQKEQLVAIPDMDVDGILMQLGGLKKVVMHLTNAPHWSSQSKQQSAQKATTVKAKAAADWNTLWAWLKRFVIVSHQDNDPNVLPTPEHFQSVQDSVYLSLSTAQWAVLHQNVQVYKHALTAAVSQLDSIKQSDPKVVKQLAAQLQTLAKITINPKYPSLDGLMNTIVSMQDQMANAHKRVVTAATTMPTPEVKAEKSYSSKKTKTDKATKTKKPIANEVIA